MDTKSEHNFVVIPTTKCSHKSLAPIEIIEKLPITQAGPGRHRCPVCAYELGYSEGVKAGIKQTLEKLNLWIQDPNK